jgi:hypothetical protein
MVLEWQHLKLRAPCYLSIYFIKALLCFQKARIHLLKCRACFLYVRHDLRQLLLFWCLGISADFWLFHKFYDDEKDKRSNPPNEKRRHVEEVGATGDN